MAVGEIDSDGHLELEEDPEAWIKRNPASLLSSVTSLKLDLDGEVKEIGESIGELTHLIRLNFFVCTSLKRVPNTITRLRYLYHLQFHCCFRLEELPANIGQLLSLTHLKLSDCDKIKCLPNSIANLSNLTSLVLKSCESLVGLPANIGQLVSLTHLQLSDCKKIKYLPNSIAKLFNLTSLVLELCESLVGLPANIGQLVSLTHLKLSDCKKIKYLPNSIANLPNLTSLVLQSCESLVGLPANIVSLTHLELSVCDKINSLVASVADLPNLTSLSLQSYGSLSEIPSNLGHLKKTLTHLSLSHYDGEMEFPISVCYQIKSLPNSIASLSNLTSLSLSYCFFLVELPPDLDGLAHLCLLDIQKSRIKCLSWSIMKLRKLRHLLLPTYFRLQTLPDTLNNLVIISVEHRHVRKSWEELKKEMPKLSVQIVGEVPNDSIQNPSTIYPPGYLRLKGDPSQWIINKENLLMFVRVLDLEDVKELTDSISQFSQLTHLYLCNKVDVWLPDNFFVTLTSLRHLSLGFDEIVDIGDVSILHSLSKFSNLESLHLCLFRVEIPADIDMPDSLSHLSLSNCRDMRPLVDSLKKLTNLKTLDLCYCDDCDSLPNLNLDKLQLFNCFFDSLSIDDLRHLEVLYNDDFNDCWGFLNQLVNLETLSITSYNMEFLPEEIARLRTLQILQLKDCVNLRELPSNLHELVNLHTLDISVTRIKSLPPCFVKLRNLQSLILPKCFNLESLPRHLNQVYTIDDTEEIYYKRMNYGASLYQTSAATSDESKYKEAEQCVVPGESCNSGNDNVPIARMNENVLVEQTSGDHLMGYPEHITSEQGGVSQMYKDFHLYGSKDPVGENRQAHHTPFISPILFTPEYEDFTVNLLGRVGIRSSSEMNNQHARTLETNCQHISSCDKYSFVGGLNNSQRHDAIRQGKQILEATADCSKSVCASNNISSMYGAFESSSYFKVKATYKEDTVAFEFSLSNSIDQLKGEVANQLQLGVNTFKIKYQDEDGEWILLNRISDLKHALYISRSSNNSVVRLLIVLKT